MRSGMNRSDRLYFLLCAILTEGKNVSHAPAPYAINLWSKNQLCVETKWIKMHSSVQNMFAPLCLVLLYVVITPLKYSMCFMSPLNARLTLSLSSTRDKGQTEVCGESKIQHTAPQSFPPCSCYWYMWHVTCWHANPLLGLNTVVQTCMVVCSDEHGVKWLIFTLLDSVPVNNSCPAFPRSKTKGSAAPVCPYSLSLDI